MWGFRSEQSSFEKWKRNHRGMICPKNANDSSKCPPPSVFLQSTGILPLQQKREQSLEIRTSVCFPGSRKLRGPTLKHLRNVFWSQIVTQMLWMSFIRLEFVQFPCFKYLLSKLIHFTTKAKPNKCSAAFPESVSGRGVTKTGTGARTKGKTDSWGNTSPPGRTVLSLSGHPWRNVMSSHGPGHSWWRRWSLIWSFRKRWNSSTKS